MIKDLNETSLYGVIQYHNWEERGPEKDLPESTLIGLEGFSFDENEGRWLIRYALGVSSYMDANLLREIELLGAVHERLRQGNKINLLELSNGQVAGELVISDFRLMPMSQSELRNYRVIGMELLRTGT